MNRTRNIIRLIRPKQWIKNVFVMLPMFFGGELFDAASLRVSLLTFMVFSLAASSIYCYNDIVDVDADRHHPVKCRRPVASGAVAWNIRQSSTAATRCVFMPIGIRAPTTLRAATLSLWECAGRWMCSTLNSDCHKR